MSKKTFALDKLTEMPAEQVIDRIQHEGYSLLATLGAEKMRREMVPVGKVCNAVVNYVINTTGPAGDDEAHERAARAKLVKLLQRLAPGTYDGIPSDSKGGLVVGFNHPSLGEIGRIMLMKMDVMGEKPMLFPVNLPWYEALAANYDNIRRLGIIITPTITPSTWKKMALANGTPEYEAGARLKREFRDLYTRLSRETVKNGGVIFVAPSATRQATVFKDKAVYEKKEPIIPTMSVLAIDLYSDPEMDCEFLPLAVLPEEGYKRGLNMFRPYQLIPGQAFTAAEIRKKYLKKGADKLPEFDWDFHKRIADKLPKEMWY